MKIVVIGGTGRAGSRIVARLTAAGHQAVGASPSAGVDTLTGLGLDAALQGADAVIDASNAPPGDPLGFFTRSTRTLMQYEARAGVRHHLLLSIVGADRMPDAPYMRAKVAQEKMVRDAGIDHTIVRATQFHEFVPTLAEVFTRGDVIRAPVARMRPVALDDVGEIVSSLITKNPSGTTVEIGGPEAMTISEAISRVLGRAREKLRVVSDEEIRYFGSLLEDDTLLPGAGAQLGRVKLEESIVGA